MRPGVGLLFPCPLRERVAVPHGHPRSALAFSPSFLCSAFPPNISSFPLLSSLFSSSPWPPLLSAPSCQLPSAWLTVSAGSTSRFFFVVLFARPSHTPPCCCLLRAFFFSLPRLFFSAHSAQLLAFYSTFVGFPPIFSASYHTPRVQQPLCPRLLHSASHFLSHPLPRASYLPSTLVHRIGSST
jgi:hypothetical protein